MSETPTLTPVKFRVEGLRDPWNNGSVFVEWRGEDSWAIILEPWCWSRLRGFVVEPVKSERTPEFFSECRFRWEEISEELPKVAEYFEKRAKRGADS